MVPKGTTRKTFLCPFDLLTNEVMPKIFKVPKNSVSKKPIKQMYAESENGELNAAVFFDIILIVKTLFESMSKYFVMTSSFVFNLISNE